MYGPSESATEQTGPVTTFDSPTHQPREEVDGLLDLDPPEAPKPQQIEIARHDHL
jgi:hypothetical protein